MKKIELSSGEFAVENAPHTQLEDGTYCIPQHYLKYQHTLASVEELMLKIDYSNRYPLFISQDNQGIYLQVGIIGVDNYSGNHYGDNLNAAMADVNTVAEDFSAENKAQSTDDKDNTLKLVYGRKWRVEPNLPSAEVVQTAFLAIKKAREHEVRELFRLLAFNKVTTPFNTHHDVTMLSNSEAQLKKSEPEKSRAHIQQELDNVKYDQASFNIINIDNRRNKYWVVEIEVSVEPATALPEIEQGQLIVLIVNKLTFNTVCYQLMAELISLSDQHVDEHFTFLKVARFSQQNDIKAIAKISANTRELHKSSQQSDFVKHWRQENYQVDLSRVPQLSAGVLSDRIRGLLSSFNTIEGILPDNT